jgi:16S rRNA G966 N2-methylase RsmD
MARARPKAATLAADFIDGYLADRAALPVSTGAAPPREAPTERLVPGSRNTAFYLAHSYHTKVPPEAIRPFIEHFSKPGEVVLDPFCGSGMTGVAAALAGRQAILNDLSPAAAHLAWNHTRRCDPGRLSAAFERIAEHVGEALGELYRTTDERGLPATIRWMLWSTRHRCPNCFTTFMLWDTIERSTGRLGRATECPVCLHRADRRRFEVVANEPVWVAFERADGGRGEKPATDADRRRSTAVQIPADLWRPRARLGPDREMYLRCALHLQGVADVTDLYTPRNLKALALIWREIEAIADDRIRRALAFAFTNTAWHGTRMRRFNARGGHRPLTGTLYVPQLSSEANVLKVMRKKIAQLVTYYRSFAPSTRSAPHVLLGSATALEGVADASVDYVFTDPPFGSNIFYADCNLIWEAWLGRLTEPGSEAVVNRSLGAAKGGKTLDDYARLMQESLAEMARVLKPGGWATVVFHNTDAAVWRALSEAAARAGFEFHEAASLDRKQQSHKGYKGRAGTEDVAHFDVVMNLRKPDQRSPDRPAPVDAEFLDLSALVAVAWASPEVAARGLQGVHAEVMRRLMSAGRHDVPDFSDVRAEFHRLTL